MSPQDLQNVKQAVRRVLDEANRPVPAREFLSQIIANGLDKDQVISAVRQMLDSAEVQFDVDMHLCLVKQMA